MLLPDDEQVREVVGRFCAEAEAVSISALGQGNINDTFLVDDGRGKIVVQRLNRAVFPRAEEVAANFAVVSRHIARASQVRTVIFSCSQPVFTLTGEVFHLDKQGNCWRAQTYLEHLPFRELQLTGDAAIQLGRVLALFHLLTADLDPGRLSVPLPGFHITPLYLRQFDEAVVHWNDAASPELSRCFRCVDTYRHVADRLEEARRKGRIPLRTIHGDPKLDNIIFDVNGRAMGLFDLDTTGPGLIHYDLGDCLRSSCNGAGEAAESWNRVDFNLDTCQAVLTGYLQTAGETLSPWDLHYIYDAVLVITFELGLRFLTDHLRGDPYFKVTAPRQNLFRALGQFQLVESIVRQEKAIRACIDRLGGELLRNS